MRLQLESNDKQDKEIKKSKSTSKKKLTEVEKLYKQLSKNYADTSEFKYSNISIQINKLQYNHILHCKPDCIITENGVIKVNSWIELLVSLLDTFRINALSDNLKLDIIRKEQNLKEYDFKKKKVSTSENGIESKDKFILALAEYEITQRDFLIDKIFGKLDFDREIKAYRIYDTEYYIESSMNHSIIFDVIVKTIDALNMNLEHTAIHLINIDECEDIESIQLNSVIKTVDKIYKNGFNDLKTNRELLSVIFDGMDEVKFENNTEKEINRQVIFLFFKYITMNYSLDDIQQLTKHRGKTRITININLNNGIQFNKDDNIIYGYTDDEYKSIYEFIDLAVKTLEIPKDNLKFKYNIVKKHKN